MVWPWSIAPKEEFESKPFIQLSPDGVVRSGDEGQAFLITEAVRGDGGICATARGGVYGAL